MTVEELAEEAIKKLGEDMIDAMKYMLPVGGTYQVQHGNNKNTITLPEGTQLNLWDWNKVADEIASVNEDMSCKHEWVNVGFHFDKWVCKKCDVNKGSNE